MYLARRRHIVIIKIRVIDDGAAAVAAADDIPHIGYYVHTWMMDHLRWAQEHATKITEATSNT